MERELLLGSFQAALRAADPLHIVPPHLPKPPRGRTVVVGAGKAAASMARAVEAHWPRESALEGVVVTRYGHGLPLERIEVIEASHPVPDDAGEAAAKRILDLAVSLGPQDLLLVLVSGGGSALLSLPAEGISMADLKAVTRELLACGAPIEEINTVRKHLSRIQGGRLAAATRAQVLALIVSDVTGDDPTHIASGPCAPDPTTYADALAVLARFGVKAPSAIEARLRNGAAGSIAETPKPGDPVFSRTDNRVIATAHASLVAAAQFVQARGFKPVVLGDSVTGEASEVAKVYAALAREVRLHGEPAPPPVALISGGETTVTMRGKGRGGRCTEFLLSLAVALDGQRDTWALACDTDGIDGSEDNAGAILTPDALSRARGAGLEAKRLLADNDGYGFFSALGDLVVTGPTRTNVNDYRVILVG
ncbi:MAG TPA: glycerate kinase [Usitatibacter sp.]|nr:glycerate kinase [Usitatibacter sp.]